MKKLKKVLLSVLIPVLITIILTFGFVFVNSNKNEKKEIPNFDNIYPQTIPGVYYASAQEVEESGVAFAPMSQKGGSIYVGNGSTYTISGGIVQSHYATYGGAVYVAAGGTLNMTGGILMFNQAVCGGAIYVEAGGTVNLTGGSITGNAADTGAAIYLADGATLNQSADFVLTNNYTDIYDKYVVYYVDDKIHSVASLDASDGKFDLDAAPLDYEHCNGYFSDSDYIHGVEDGETIYTPSAVQSATANNFETVRLYTKTATPEKLTFTLNSDNNTYNVKQIDTTTTTGVVVIPREYNAKTVTVIYGDYPPNAAFCNNTNISIVYLPNCVTSIGDRAFNGCTGLTEITIPSSVTSIGDFVFSYCAGLISITVASGNTVYDNRDNCNAIIKTATNELIQGCQNTIIPNTVTSIGYSAFYGCTGLTEITIPDGVALGMSSFSYCTGLTNITCGTGVSCSRWTFSSCTNIENVYYRGDLSSWSSGDAIICEDSNWTLYINNQAITDLLIPYGVSRINNFAFAGCSITSAVISETVIDIDNYAFENCTNLTSVTFENPNGWKTKYSGNSISSATFADISTAATYLVSNYNPIQRTDEDLLTFTAINGGYKVVLKSGVTASGVFVIPETYNNQSVIKIDSYAFQNNTDIQRLVIPGTVKAIGDSAFNGCSNLSIIDFDGTIENWCHISIGSGYVNSGWTLYLRHEEINELVIPGEVGIINSVFYDCTGLTKVTIDSGVTRINNSAFGGCKNLTQIILPDTMTRIDGWGICDTGITSIVIPSSITTLEQDVFYACPNLATVVVDSETIAGLSSSNSNLIKYATTVYVKDTITSVGTYITNSFTLQGTSDKAGYKKYVKNA